MKKGKIIEALILPEKVIQHIQSFLNGKTAARTTILSKSWCYAWLTRPTLDFDHRRDFPDRSPPFEEFLKKTMQRYQDLNLKVDRFRLCMNTLGRRRELARDLIAKAINFGATHLEIELYSFPPPPELPQEVLASKTLVALSAKGYCQVIRNGPITISGLKSLSLEHVAITGDVLKDIITCCSSSIEELSLSQCTGLILSSMNLHKLHKLRRLFLRRMVVDGMFFTNFSSRFPCLKDLAILCCDGYSRIQIASTSLETIRLESVINPEYAMFEVPNIRKFTYYPYTLPSPLCIKAGSSREWEFDVSLDCNPLDKASTWCLNLKELLQKFSPSRISLYVQLICAFDVCTEIVPKPLVVENLSIEAPPSLCCALMIRLFGICRPKFVTQYRLAQNRLVGNRWHSNSSFGVVYERLMHQVITPNCGIPDQDMFGKFGLKRVNLDVYEEVDDKEGRRLVLEAPLDVTKAPECDQKLRFELIWDF